MNESFVENRVQESISKRKFDVNEIRKEFPILSREVNGKPLVYLDNAATTQKPSIVIEAIKHYYTYENANIHRGVHYLSEVATELYENGRVKIKEYINAMSASEIVFVRGATEAINLLATTMERSGFFKENDEIIISQMEHHANIVPWQIVSETTGAKLRVIPVNEAGEIEFEEFKKMVNEKTKIVSIVHTSNSLGTINPVKEIIDYSHKFDIPVIIDGAQAMAHTRIDVQELDCDFFVFSGHKVFGPTGIGVLYGKAEFLEKLPPYQGGGDMIRQVTFEGSTYNDLPHKFEAGTPNIVGGIAQSVALLYLNQFDFNDIELHEMKLLKYATEELMKIEGMKIIGTSDHKTSVISFIIEGLHPYDIGTLVNNDGIALRTGHHCTQPIMQKYCVPATARASFSIYNTLEEVDMLVASLHKVKKIFG